MARTDLHTFHGHEVIENEHGRLSIMVPYRNRQGELMTRPEGDFETRAELAAYCHGKLIKWMEV